MHRTLRLYQLLTLAALGAGCGCAATPPAAPPKVADTPSAQSGLSQQDSDNWQLNNCLVTYTQNGLKLSTDGYMSNGSYGDLRLALVLPRPVSAVPKVSLWGIGGFDLNLQGRGQNWAIDFPNDPASVARILAHQVFIVVQYTPLPTSYEPAPTARHEVISTTTLPTKIAAKQASCDKSKED